MTKQQNDSLDPSTFRTGVFLGFTIGGLLTIWYAPQSGAETRARLRFWGRRGAQEVSERVQGESIEASLQTGKAIAHHNRAQAAEQIPDTNKPPETLSLEKKKK